MLRTITCLLGLFFLLIISPVKGQELPELKLVDSLSSIKIGGALRFNYNYSNWLEQSKKEGGELGYDAFWLEVNGNYKALIFKAQYRIYAQSSGGGMLREGWIGYQFNPENQLQVGLNIVPFGALPYNSHNWFFNITYYVGLEDNADMGIKYSYDNEKWAFDAAFYKNADILDFHSSDGINPSRYAYDVAGRNKEINQGNLRLVRGFGDRIKHEVGASALLGGLYNIDTQQTGSKAALGLHYILNYKNWDFRAEAITYNMAPKNAEKILDPNGDQFIPNPESNGDYVQMAAYGAPYNVASKAAIYTAALAHNWVVNKGVLDVVTIYNDFGVIHKRHKDFKDSYQNVTGVMLSMGPVFTYIDYAVGKNHSWLGSEWNNAFAQGGNHWGGRFNINIGYYF